MASWTPWGGGQAPGWETLTYINIAEVEHGRWGMLADTVADVGGTVEASTTDDVLLD